MKYSISIAVLLIMTACVSKQGTLQIQGKMAIFDTYYNNANPGCRMFFDGFSKRIELPNTTEKKYRSGNWLNNTNSLVCIESIKLNNNKTIRSDIVIIDTSGRIVEKIVISPNGNYISNVHPSPNDNLLLFLSETDKNDTTDFDAFLRPITLNIYNLITKEYVKKIAGFNKNCYLAFNENPWSPNEDRLVYTLSKRVKITVDGETLNNIDETNIGVYIFDLKEENNTRIYFQGQNAIWSPKGEKIAFTNKDTVLVYNISNKKVEPFYILPDNECLKSIHWTVDGESILILSLRRNNLISSGGYEERLVNLSSRKEVKLNLQIGESRISWTKISK